MRVAFVSTDPGVPVFGSKGCSIHAQEMLRFFLNDLGASVTLFTPRPGGEPPAGLTDIVVHSLGEPGGAPGDREQRLMRLNGEIESHLALEGPFDLVYERYALFGYAGMAYARRTSTPGILEVNAPLIPEQMRHRHLVHAAEAEAGSRRAFDDASAVVAVSDAVRTYVTDRCASPEKVHVVPNGVDIERFRPDVTPALIPPADAFTVGFVGSLRPWHGLADLVEAFRVLAQSVPNAQLLIVGDGPERPAMKEKLEAEGLSKSVRFTGAVSHSEVPQWLASMDVAVAPYPQKTDCYFSPLKIFEYMAAGLPVVATRTGQIPEIIEQGVTGLLPQPGRPEELAGAIEVFYKDRSLMAAMGRAARARVASHHTWSAVGRQILNLAEMSDKVRVTA